MSVVTIAALKAKYQTGDFPTEQDFIDLIDTLYNGSTSVYKKYAAVLTQSGTNAPVATVLENTIGVTLVWSYIAVGIYHVTATGQFPDRSKTWISINNASFDNQTGFYWNDANTLEFYTASLAGVYGNGKIFDACVEIRVYP